MPEPIGEAFVEIKPDFSEFDGDVKKSMAKAERVVEQHAEKIDEAISDNFKEGARSAERSLKSIGDDSKKAFSGIGKQGGVINSVTTSIAGLGSAWGAASGAIAGGVAGLGLGLAAQQIGSFVTNTVGNFQNLALQVNKFSTATGLSLDASSRWIEVAGDLGVEAGVVQKAITTMNRTVEKSPGAFEALGIEIVKTADGALDANATFKNAVVAIGQIEDPTLRATQAQKVLGKSWLELAPIIDDVDGSLGKLNGRMEDVSEQHIIDEDEIATAKRLRDAQDALGDALDNLTLILGEKLAPALIGVTNAGADFLETMQAILELDVPTAVEGMTGAWEGLYGIFRNTALGFVPSRIGEGIVGLGKNIFDLGEDAAEAARKEQALGLGLLIMVQSMNAAERQAQAYAAEQANVAFATQVATVAQQVAAQALAEAEAQTNALLQATLGLFSAEIGLRQATRDLDAAVFTYAAQQNLAKENTEEGRAAAAGMAATEDDLRLKLLNAAAQAARMAEEQAVLRGETFTAEDAIAAQRDELGRLAERFPGLRPIIQGYIDKLNAIPPTKTTDINANDNASAKANAARQAAEKIARTYTTTLNAQDNVTRVVNNVVESLRSIARQYTLTLNALNPYGRQHGGPVEAGRGYIVGERRAELFVPNVSGRILPRVPPSATTTNASSGVVFGANSVNITFVGGTPSMAEARAVGVAVGDGITQALTRRRIIATGRLAA